MVIILVVMYLKFTLFIKMTENLGILVKIVELNLKDVSYFLLILVMSILAFSTVFSAIFHNYFSDYDSFEKSVRSMTFAIFGSFNLQNGKIYFFCFQVKN